VSARILTLAAIVAVIAFLTGFREHAPNRIVDRYDHISTGFVLDGRHAELACDTCHGGAVFRGTQRTCSACHNNVRAEGKPVRHIPTANQCTTCHTTKDWLTARFDHTGVVTNCVSCHNNYNAPGKTPDHRNTSNTCSNCHRTHHWNSLIPRPERPGS
jgi:hypothetical protein